jgi:hypothetical protein
MVLWNVNNKLIITDRAWCIHGGPNPYFYCCLDQVDESIKSNPGKLRGVYLYNVKGICNHQCKC